MDVEKLRRMNSLAEALKQRGLASTRDAAATMAGSIVATPEEQAFASIAKPSVSVRPEAGARMERNMNEDQLKRVLQSFADQFVGEINRMQEKISTQEQKIARFQELLVAMQSRPAASVVATHAPPPAEHREEEVPVAVAKAVSPRSGNYGSGDVAIEKFFYCGSK
jgi:hypothetical protein